MRTLVGKLKSFFNRGHSVVFEIKKYNKIKYMYIVMFDWVHTYFILLLKFKSFK